jgi:hypothetical protein
LRLSGRFRVMVRIPSSRSLSTTSFMTAPHLHLPLASIDRCTFAPVAARAGRWNHVSSL